MLPTAEQKKAARDFDRNVSNALSYGVYGAEYGKALKCLNKALAIAGDFDVTDERTLSDLHKLAASPAAH